MSHTRKASDFDEVLKDRRFRVCSPGARPRRPGPGGTILKSALRQRVVKIRLFRMFRCQYQSVIHYNLTQIIDGNMEIWFDFR